MLFYRLGMFSSSKKKTKNNCLLLHIPSKKYRKQSTYNYCMKYEEDAGNIITFFEICGNVKQKKM